MRDAWRGPDVELVVEPTAASTAENAARTLPLLLERESGPPSSSARRRTSSGRGCASAGSTAARASRSSFRVPRLAPTVRSVAWELCALPFLPLQLRRRAGRARSEAVVSDTVVFIPAWNEEENLPAVLDELHEQLPRGGRPRRRRRLDRPHGRRRARARGGGAVAGDEPGPADRDRRRLPLGARPRLRVLRARRRRRPASRGGARAAARARARGRVRRRGRLPVRLRGGLRAVPLPAEPRRGGWGPACCDARWVSCCAVPSATRRAVSTR